MIPVTLNRILAPTSNCGELYDDRDMELLMSQTCFCYEDTLFNCNGAVITDLREVL